MACLLVVATGCNGSRWARHDPAYAAKYPEHSDSLKQMAKQAVDARHVAGRSGLYVDGATGIDPFAAAGSIGGFWYDAKKKGAVEHRLGFAFLGAERVQGGEDHSSIAGGVDLGIRLQAPSRVAPFVGVGGFAGYYDDSDADSDGRDNNQNGLIDEFGEEDKSLLAALYPEVGVHVWATPRLRLTAFARHYFATTFDDGRDYQTLGVSLSWLDIPGAAPRRAPARAAAERLMNHQLARSDDHPPPAEHPKRRLPPTVGSVAANRTGVEPPHTAPPQQATNPYTAFLNAHDASIK